LRCVSPRRASNDCSATVCSWSRSPSPCYFSPPPDYSFAALSMSCATTPASTPPIRLPAQRSSSVRAISIRTTTVIPHPRQISFASSSAICFRDCKPYLASNQLLSPARCRLAKFTTPPLLLDRLHLHLL